LCGREQDGPQLMRKSLGGITDFCAVGRSAFEIFALGTDTMLGRSVASRPALFRRLVLTLAALQVFALAALIQVAPGGKSWAATVLWTLAGAWAAGWWAAVQRRRARIALGLAHPHRLEDALEVIGTAALAPIATVLAYLYSVASLVD
jgi:hypothetical protein